MKIPYVAESFPLSAGLRLAGSHELSVSWADLVWAAITTGKPGASHLIAHGWHSIADIVVRSHTIFAYLRQSGVYIEKSSLYDALDPSEKGAVSYSMGMTLAKLFASRLLNTPWIFHVSAAKKAGASIEFKRGSKSQPDLIGLMNTGDWLVVEAKGRTNGFDQKVITMAKTQTRMIRTINATAPALRVGLHAYFSPNLSVRMEDPDEIDADAVALELELKTAMLNYYATALAAIRRQSESREIGNRQFRVHADPDSGVTIGLDLRVVEYVQAGKNAEVLAVLNEFGAESLPKDSGVTIYPDGIMVGLDWRWSPDMMAKEPDMRVGG